MRLQPTNLPLLALHAELLFRRGYCTEMNAVIRRALGVESESLASEQALRLHEISRTCGTSAAR